MALHARFQAEVGYDDTYPVESPGEDTWELTPEEEKIARTAREEIDYEAADALSEGDSPDIPAWVRTWPGPFTVFFVEDDGTEWTVGD